MALALILGLIPQTDGLRLILDSLLFGEPNLSRVDLFGVLGKFTNGESLFNKTFYLNFRNR